VCCNRYIAAGEHGIRYDKEKISSKTLSRNWLRSMLTGCASITGRSHAGNLL